MGHVNVEVLLEWCVKKSSKKYIQPQARDFYEGWKYAAGLGAEIKEQ